MRRFFYLLPALLFISFFYQCTNTQKEDSSDVSNDIAPKFPLKRGVNISHWLSQSNVRGEERKAFFTRDDVDFIDSIGYDHIRIPIDEEQMWDEDGNKEEEAFGLLHNAIGWAQEANLSVIVDLHILRSHHFNADEKPLWTEPAAQEQFIACWRDLSSELKKYPNDVVAYELMNEPVADDPEEWNILVGKAARAVRENEPERFLVIGSNRWQSVFTFDELKIPENDPYVILSFHFYHPMLITHYKASWTGVGAYQGAVSYPGQLTSEEDIAAIDDPTLKALITKENGIFNIDSLEKMMEKPFKKANELNLQLYCGEWGARPSIPRSSLLQWYGDVRSILEKHNVAWANWDYKGGFGIVERGDDNAPIEDLIDVLLE